MLNFVIGKVIKVKFWTDVLFTLTVNAPINPFIAGQFTKLRLKINGKYIQRAYSYVNAPSNQNLEFYIVNVLGGKLSPKLAKLQSNDKIEIAKESKGFFIIKKIPNCQTLWMLATGTAIGPYLSILEHGKDLNRFKDIVLVHSVRYFMDLSYLSKMLELKKIYDGKLRIQTIVSREKIFGSLTGRIPELISNNKLEKEVNLSISVETSHVMLCGNPNMVNDTKNLLRETRGMKINLFYQPGHITIENYW